MIILNRAGKAAIAIGSAVLLAGSVIAEHYAPIHHIRQREHIGVKVDAGLKEQQRKLKEKYGILVTNDTHAVPGHVSRGWSCIPMSGREFMKLLPEVERELDQYSLTFLRNAGVKYICLCKSPEKGDVPISGFMDERSTIYVCLPRYIPHELYHLADLHDGGLYNDNSSWREIQDPASTVSSNAYMGPKGLKSDVHLSPEYLALGYPNQYSMTEPDEDQAEIFELMFSRTNKLRDAELGKITGFKVVDDSSRAVALELLAKEYPLIGKKMDWIREFYRRLSH